MKRRRAGKTGGRVGGERGVSRSRKRVTREARMREALMWIEDKLKKELACRQHTLRACIHAARRALR